MELIYTHTYCTYISPCSVKQTEHGLWFVSVGTQIFLPFDTKRVFPKREKKYIKEIWSLRNEARFPVFTHDAAYLRIKIKCNEANDNVLNFCARIERTLLLKYFLLLKEHFFTELRYHIISFILQLYILEQDTHNISFPFTKLLDPSYRESNENNVRKRCSSSRVFVEALSQ